MNSFFKNLRSNILFSTLVCISLFVFSYIILKIGNMEFRKWVYYPFILLSLIGIVSGLIQIAKRKSKKIKIIIFTLLIALCILMLVFWQIILLIFAFSYTPEHVVEKNGKKYVAEVISFLHVDVYYYDYIDPFIKGSMVKIHEDYGKGGYDPFDNGHENNPISTTYYDEYGKAIKKY